MSNFPSVENFAEQEFACKCGCKAVDMRPDFIISLQSARNRSSTKFTITSGYRCAKHNATVGGRTTSSHLKGCAADIAADNAPALWDILSSLIAAGFVRIGIGSDFVHVDSDIGKTPRLVWLYPWKEGKDV